MGFDIAEEIAARLGETIQKLPDLNKEKRKYIGSIKNILSFHVPLGGIDAPADKEKQHDNYAGSIVELTKFVKDVMDMCISVHGKHEYAWTPIDNFYSKQISRLGFMTAAKLLAEEGSSEQASKHFHFGFHFLSANRHLKADPDLLNYLSKKSGHVADDQKYAAFERILYREVGREPRGGTSASTSTAGRKRTANAFPKTPRPRASKTPHDKLTQGTLSPFTRQRLGQP